VTGRALRLFATPIIIFCFLAAAARAQNGINPASSITMISSLTAEGDGLNAVVTCSTAGSTAAATYYAGFSTVCNVSEVGSPGSIVASSVNNPSCNTNPTGPHFPNLGGSNYGNPVSRCTFTFQVTPGTAYQLTSQHFLWLNPNGPTLGGVCPSNTFADPLAYWDDVHSYVPWAISATNNSWSGTTTAVITPPSLGITETGTVNGGAWTDDGCHQPADMIVQSGVPSGAWQVGITDATFTAITITPGEGDFFQTQYQYF
jgi:hypothetical protein